MDALNEQFGTAAESADPKGGIFLWVELPDEVDTLKFYQPALAPASPSIRGRNRPPTSHGKCRTRPVLRQSIPQSDPRPLSPPSPKSATSEFGVPDRIANVDQAQV